MRTRPLVALEQAVRRYVADGMVERAPALAYYGILSLFPVLLLGSAMVRLVAGAGAPADLAELARGHGVSGALGDALRSAATTAQQASGETASAAGLVGLGTLLYGASRAFTATGRALDVIRGGGSAQRSLARRAEDLAWTLVVLVMVLAVLALTALGGDLLRALAEVVGLRGAFPWWLVRWPVLAVTTLLIVAVVRWSAPTGSRPPFRLVSAGNLLSVVVLLVVTRGFDLYATTIAAYNDTYGAFAGAIILILWLWLSAGTFLLGAELDDVLAARGGAPHPDRPARRFATHRGGRDSGHDESSTS